MWPQDEGHKMNYDEAYAREWASMVDQPVAAGRALLLHDAMWTVQHAKGSDMTEEQKERLEKARGYLEEVLGPKSYAELLAAATKSNKGSYTGEVVDGKRSYKMTKTDTEIVHKVISWLGQRRAKGVPTGPFATFVSGGTKPEPVKKASADKVEKAREDVYASFRNG